MALSQTHKHTHTHTHTYLFLKNRVAGVSARGLSAFVQAGVAGGAGEGGGQRDGADRGRCGGHRANVLLLSVQALGPALHVFGDLSAETPNESTT